MIPPGPRVCCESFDDDGISTDIHFHLAASNRCHWDRIAPLFRSHTCQSGMFSHGCHDVACEGNDFRHIECVYSVTTCRPDKSPLPSSDSSNCWLASIIDYSALMMGLSRCLCLRGVYWQSRLPEETSPSPCSDAYCCLKSMLPARRLQLVLLADASNQQLPSLLSARSASKSSPDSHGLISVLRCVLNTTDDDDFLMDATLARF